MILYISDALSLARKLEMINKLSRVSRYKIILHKVIVFLYQQQSYREEMLDTLPLIIASNK